MQRIRKNIVFIMADQLAASFIGCYGSGVASTPNLDALAAEGMRFDRSYAAAPVCAPNRACILSGRSCCVNGVNENNFVFPNDSPLYPEVLRQHGYVTGGFGKFHATPMMWPVPNDLSHLGFTESVISDDVKWGPYIDWVKKTYPEQYAKALATTNEHSGHVVPMRDVELRQGATEEQFTIKEKTFFEEVEPRLKASSWPRMYASVIDPKAHDDVFITEQGLHFLENHAQDEAPFFCHISYVDPHDPYNPPKPYDQLFKPEDMPDPAPKEWENVPYLEGIRDNYLHFRQICDNPQEVKKLRALYHGSIKLLDEQIGRVIQKVKELGLWENTVIVFATDHGDLMGDHGLIAKGEAHYDACIRTPLLVAGSDFPKGISNRLTTSLDLYPTFCEWAGITELPPLEGTSLSKPEHKEVLVHFGASSTVITDDGWRLTLHDGKVTNRQLFDLKNDPQEQHNRYEDFIFEQKRTELLERLVKVLAEPWKMQYKNLPVKHGFVYTNINQADAPRYPHIQVPQNPWTTEMEKPEWHGK